MFPVYALHPDITVNSILDVSASGDGNCTLCKAIGNANTNSDTTGGDCSPGNGSDKISFPLTLIGQTTSLSGTELSISNNVLIEVPGASRLTINAGNASRVFHITGDTITISEMTIRDGQIAIGNGTGIANAETLTLDSVTVTANSITGVMADPLAWRSVHPRR